MYFLGVKLKEKHENADSLLSLSPRRLVSLRVKSEPCAVTDRLSGRLSASPVSRLSSPQTFFWPLRTLVPFGALVNAILHHLTWLIPTSFSGFNSDTPPAGDLIDPPSLRLRLVLVFA